MNDVFDARARYTTVSTTQLNKNTTKLIREVRGRGERAVTMTLRYAALSSLILPIVALCPRYPRRCPVRWSSRPLFNSIPDGSKVPSEEASVAVVCGDFAGLSATFSPSDGSIIPVPEHLVPESLVEWDQIPEFCEVITSEELKPDGETYSFTRQTVRVLPEVGCGVDNLETTKSEEKAQLYIDESGSDGHVTMFGNEVVALQYALPPRGDVSRQRVETTFGLQNKKRIRVMLDLELSERSFSIQSPVTMVLERQTSTTSTNGTIADGGGLDARTVSTLIGTDIRNDLFPRQKRLESDMLSGGWKQSRDDDAQEPGWLKSGSHMLTLAGNVTIAYSSEVPFTLDVVHVLKDESGRSMVRRQYDSKGMLQGDAQYWVESKELQHNL